MIVRIQVTAGDIAAGEPGNGCDCPVARACRRMFPSLPDLTVGRWDLFFGEDEDSHALLPAAATEFVEKFDACQDVEPFGFDLDIPDELAPAGAS